MTDGPHASDGDASPTHLLWTGGWDSTFRLLDLVLTERRPVKPCYLIDLRRRSTLHELRAMARIRAGIARLSPEAGQRIGTTTIVSAGELPRDPDLVARFHALLARSYLGAQYVDLAQLARHLDVGRLELSVHADDRAAVLLEGVLRPDEAPGRRVVWALDAAHADGDVGLFAGFRFPLLPLTKSEMLAIAAREGFAGVLEQTWFCHTPTRGGRPCGVCAPCKYTIEEGLGRRVPWPGRAKHAARRIPGARWLYRRLVPER